jgi:hypothetical protein
MPKNPKGSGLDFFTRQTFSTIYAKYFSTILINIANVTLGITNNIKVYEL